MKLLKYLSVSALVVVIAACGGKKEEAQATEEGAAEGTAVEVVDEEVVEVDDSATEATPEATEEATDQAAADVNINDLLNSFSQAADKVVATTKKVAGGDIKAVAELASLQKDYDKIAFQLKAVSSQFTPEQKAKYEDILKKIADVAK